MRSLSSILLTLSCAIALVGCSDDPSAPSSSSSATSSASSSGAGGTGGGAGGGSACRTLKPEATTINFEGIFAWVSLSAKVDAPLEGYDKTRLTLELYQDDGS